MGVKNTISKLANKMIATSSVTFLRDLVGDFPAFDRFLLCGVSSSSSSGGAEGRFFLFEPLFPLNEVSRSSPVLS